MTSVTATGNSGAPNYVPDNDNSNNDTSNSDQANGDAGTGQNGQAPVVPDTHEEPGSGASSVGASAGESSQESSSLQGASTDSGKGGTTDGTPNGTTGDTTGSTTDGATGGVDAPPADTGKAGQGGSSSASPHEQPPTPGSGDAGRSGTKPADDAMTYLSRPSVQFGAAPASPDPARQPRAADQVQESGRPTRQTPAASTGNPTEDAYRSTASETYDVSYVALAHDAGQPPSALRNHCAGLVATTMETIDRNIGQGGQGGAQAPTDLMGATEQISGQLANPETRQQMLNHLHESQETNRDGLMTPLPNHERFAGDDETEGSHDLVDELQSEFGSPHTTNDLRYTEEFTAAEISLRFGDAQEDHAILVQRPHPGTYAENDHTGRLNDEYQLYDPNYGVFRYQTFNQLASALHNLYEHGYPDQGGVVGAHTEFLADTSTRWPITGLGSNNTAPGMPPGLTLGNQAQLQPDPQLPPPPDFDLPGPSGMGGGPHSELKRSTDNPIQPFGLYRPSDQSPEEVKAKQGFHAGNTLLRDVSLDRHDSEVAGKSGAVDGAGYLGAFRTRDQAVSKLDASGQPGGYIYSVAPSPNMVDVAASLGNGNARAPGNGEVAAMGGIDYTQIRGWQQRNADGTLGQYQANPDYRWDVYDQTTTSGAQPQLAHFGAANPAWADAAHAPFVTAVQNNGTTLYRPNEDPQLVTARFMGNAQADIAERAGRQAQHLDYRGPVSIRPTWANDDGSTRLTVRGLDGNAYPSVDSGDLANAAGQFRFGDDGRIHVDGDYGKVLRIGSDGNAYVGAVPEDRNNTNGVFGYDSGVGGLIQQEDGKWLTEGIFARTPYVATPQAVGGGLIDRQRWRLVDAQGHEVTPPLPESAFTTNSTAGTSEQLYRFYERPDSALPAGATHFVTQVPGMQAHEGENFLDWPRHLAQGDARAARDWLAQHNAAWLFKDGFYATATGPNALEVRTIGGKPVWRAQIDPTTGRETYTMLQNGLSSNYQMPQRTWNMALAADQRDRALYAAMQQNYM